MEKTEILSRKLSAAGLIHPLRTGVALLTHGGEADSDGRRLAHVFKQFGLAIAGDVMSHLKVAKRSWIK